MSELSLTADRLIIIGRGRLIAQTTARDFLSTGSGGSVRVRSPQAGALAALLTALGATVARQAGDTLTITGATSDAVGEIASLAPGAVVSRLVVTWQINGQWQYDPDPGHASEIEVRFTADGPGQTTVELEHRLLERLAGGQAIHDAIRGGGGWTAMLELFAKATADTE
jgi:hypothetical protein